MAAEFLHGLSDHFLRSGHEDFAGCAVEPADNRVFIAGDDAEGNRVQQRLGEFGILLGLGLDHPPGPLSQQQAHP